MGKRQVFVGVAAGKAQTFNGFFLCDGGAYFWCVAFATLSGVVASLGGSCFSFVAAR